MHSSFAVWFLHVLECILKFMYIKTQERWFQRCMHNYFLRDHCVLLSCTREQQSWHTSQLWNVCNWSTGCIWLSRSSMCWPEAAGRPDLGNLLRACVIMPKPSVFRPLVALQWLKRLQCHNCSFLPGSHANCKHSGGTLNVCFACDAWFSPVFRK